MKTDDLIQTLSADLHPAARVEKVLPIVLIFTTLVFGGSFLAVAGVRPDLGQALEAVDVAIKQAAPPVMAAAGFGLSLRMSQPGAGPGPWLWLLLAGPLIVLAAMAAQLLILPMDLWPVAMRGHSRFVCLSMIPLISLPILAGSVFALRSGAPIRPGLCGATAGLMSGTAAASAYAFFCTDDNPLFYGTWYGAAILIVTLAGFILGRRVLHW
jgi:hypothetical protein